MKELFVTEKHKNSPIILLKTHMGTTSVTIIHLNKTNAGIFFKLFDGPSNCSYSTTIYNQINQCAIENHDLQSDQSMLK